MRAHQVIAPGHPIDVLLIARGRSSKRRCQRLPATIHIGRHTQFRQTHTDRLIAAPAAERMCIDQIATMRTPR
jgi:hypothetical protein